MELSTITGRWTKDFAADFPELRPDEAAEALRAALLALRDYLPHAEPGREAAGELSGTWLPGGGELSPELEEGARSRLHREGLPVNAARAVRSAWKVLVRRAGPTNLAEALRLFPQLHDVHEIPYARGGLEGRAESRK